MTDRPDYGVDAPLVLRNLFLTAALGLACTIVIRTGLWSGRIHLGSSIVLEVRGMAVAVTVVCALMGAWMFWTSKVGKIREREQLLDLVPWTGSERVLDIGCGRGLMLIGAARRSPRGLAVGVDIWQAEDLTGNRPEATLENARREGVADRVRVETADMRQLPFPDASFDRIVSSAAIHNLYDRASRGQAIAELARVLAPGGYAILDDIRHIGEYRQALGAAGLEVRRTGSPWLAWLLFALTFGSLQPGTVVAHKPRSAPART